LRDTDGGIYVREEVGGLLMGGFESVAKPWGMHGLPKDFAFSLLPEDWEHFRVLMEQAIVRIPALETAPVRRHVNGPESFTPDNRYMLGEAPELRNCLVAGWERANWFATAGVEPRYVYTYGRQNWFPCAAAEHRAVREGVGLFDQSSLAKFRLQGPDATAVLQRLCANDVDLPPGRIVYTQMLNPRGGIECDLTVTRLAD